MRPNAVPAFFAVMLGVFFVAVGAINFARVSTAEQRTDYRLARIRAGAVQPDTLTVMGKYVNPGRYGLPHLVLRAPGHPKVDVSSTRDVFNAVSPGETMPGYYFPDGYFIPRNYRDEPRANKWVFLGFALVMGFGTFAFAVAVFRFRGPRR